MKSAPVARVVLALALVAGVGVVTEASKASATGATSHRVEALAKKKAKKKQKPLVKTAQSNLGTILVNAKGKTIYAFDVDGTDTSKSKCNCPSVWRPVESKGKPRGGSGVTSSKLSVNSSKQVAYNDHLLYTYSGDSSAGQMNGQGIGGVWHVVGSDGEPIRQ